LGDQGKGIVPGTDIEVYDALMTTQPGIALFLPLADCVGAILYDPTKKVLMVSHLGRHNIEQQGALKSVEYMKDNAGVEPNNLKVWLSPSAGKENYPLFAFDNKSQQDVVLEQLKEAGVSAANIETANVDTTTSEDYFSHSQYLKDNSKPNGRFAIVAMLK
jgi:copper oxidase (laccase) domain-containing protein